MMDLTQPLPAYLTTRKNTIRLMIFTSAFALIFINIYAPFGVETWYKISKLELFIYSSLIILTGVLVVAISRVIMYQVVTRRGLRLNVGQYLLWIAAEIISMSLFYSLFELLILHDTRSFWIMQRIAIINTSLVLLLPYSVLWLYFAFESKALILRKLDEGNTLESPEHITFYDEKGVMRLSMKIKDLFYLKGADNYIELVYQDQEKLSKYHLRTTLKRLEAELADFPILRCHRSYMVNTDKIKLIRRESDGLVMEMDSPQAIRLPVSKTYMANVFEHFGHVPRNEVKC